MIDPRTLAPAGRGNDAQFAGQDKPVVIVDEAHLHGSAASEIAATMVAEKGFDMLDAPIKRVAAMDFPVPFSPPLEKAVIPGDPAIERAVRDVTG